MSDDLAKLAAAEAEATRARARLTDTLGALQERLEPGRLARDAKQGLVEAGGRAADHARRRPGIVAGAVAAIGLFAARHRLAALFRSRRRRKTPPGTP